MSAQVGSRDTETEGQPSSALIADESGALYGTTYFGGAYNGGSVFRLLPPTMRGGRWAETTLYSFGHGGGYRDGLTPQASLILDKSGTLYGTTELGGPYGNGTAFKLSPPSTPGRVWTETMLYGFMGSGDGGLPFGGLLPGKNGVLYGTTGGGGNFIACLSGCGTVFELTPPAAPGGKWTEHVLYRFNGNDGQQPYCNLISDDAGDLYGTTEVGGAYGVGNVFELSPPAKPGGRWTEAVLHTFTGSDGQWPVAGLVPDPAGNLYGTTFRGGNLSDCYADGGGCGTVFQLAPPSTPSGTWTLTVLYKFTGHHDGAQPLGALVRARSGALYSTTYIAGDQKCSATGGAGCGTVFKLTPPATVGGPWAFATVHAFSGGSDGADPAAGLAFGLGHALYGTTSLGGSTWPSSSGNGTVFELVR